MATPMESYLQRVNSAITFAEGTKGESWNGTFLLGLALANLELVPFGSSITPRSYWVKSTPHPDAPYDWELSWIVETDAFNKVE